MNKFTRTLTYFQIGICIESLIRVGYCIYPVILIGLFIFMLTFDKLAAKKCWK